jgi:excisionase family DNA binding protein
MDNTRLLTAREAANFLHVSLSTLWRLEHQGLIVPFRTPGGHRRYSLAMLQTYLDRSRLALSPTRRLRKPALDNIRR